MKDKEILTCCFSDREIAFRGVEIGLLKRNCLDLIVKYAILLLNSFGRKTTEPITAFVDEVNNQNMSDNLRTSYKKGLEHGLTGRYLSFYSFAMRKEHVKLGILYPLFMLLRTLLVSVPAAICSLLKINPSKWVGRKMIAFFNSYLAHIRDCDCYYLMTDHNFFSTVVAVNEHCFSRVLQHGLVLGKSLYYPVRANEFCAWGIHTRELMENDEKVKITGTYKFSTLPVSESTAPYRNVIYCVSILDNKVVEEKIRLLKKLCDESGLKLSIKLHPGSFYNMDYWLGRFDDIVFYKNERLGELDFDLAVSENSTVNLDLSVMRKPFIIYDTELGYFERYSDYIPHAKTDEEICELFRNLNSFQFVEINEILLKGEMNGGVCSIFS